MRLLRDEGVAVDGDAEPSTASGGCSEAEHPQRSKKSSKRAARRFFRAPQGGGGKYAVATFGAHLCAVRICFSRLFREKQHSYPAQLSVKGVCQGGSPVPLDRILVPFVRTKGTPRRRAVQAMPLQKAPRRRRRNAKIPCMAEATQGIFKGEVMKKAKFRREGCGRWQILRRWRG